MKKGDRFIWGLSGYDKHFGKVIEVCSSNEVIVEFDKPWHESLHSADGKGKDKHCYIFSLPDDNVAFVESFITLNDEVEIVESPFRGMKGKVVKEGYPEILVDCQGEEISIHYEFVKLLNRKKLI